MRSMVVVDARMDAQRQAVAGGVDRVDHLCRARRAFQRTTCSAGPKTSRLQRVERIDLPRASARRSCRARSRPASSVACAISLRFAAHAHGVLVERAQRVGVDHRADVGRQQARIADLELRHRAGEHRDRPCRRCRPARTARARPSSAGPADVNAEAIASLTSCSGSADESAISAFWPPVSAISTPIARIARGERAVDRARGVGGAGEGDAGDARIARQRGADGRRRRPAGTAAPLRARRLRAAASPRA